MRLHHHGCCAGRKKTCMWRRGRRRNGPCAGNCTCGAEAHRGSRFCGKGVIAYSLAGSLVASKHIYDIICSCSSILKTPQRSISNPTSKARLTQQCQSVWPVPEALSSPCSLLVSLQRSSPCVCKCALLLPCMPHDQLSPWSIQLSSQHTSINPMLTIGRVEDRVHCRAASPPGKLHLPAFLEGVKLRESLPPGAELLWQA